MHVNRRTTLLLAMVVALVVIAILLVWAFTTGTISSMGPSPPSPGALVTNGTISIASQSGGGVLSLTVKNNENNPVSSMVISQTTPSLGGLNRSFFDYNDMPVSNSNPLSIGATASGTFDFTSGGASGIHYKIVVSATLTNGKVETSTVTITAP